MAVKNHLHSSSDVQHGRIGHIYIFKHPICVDSKMGLPASYFPLFLRIEKKGKRIKKTDNKWRGVEGVDRA
jgi:hypothetical protein